MSEQAKLKTLKDVLRAKIDAEYNQRKTTRWEQLKINLLETEIQNQKDIMQDAMMTICLTLSQLENQELMPHFEANIKYFETLRNIEKK